MNVHKNARLTVHSRPELARRVLDVGHPRTSVARAFGVDAATVSNCVEGFGTEGPAGLIDRSSRPTSLHRSTPASTA